MGINIDQINEIIGNKTDEEIVREAKTERLVELKNAIDTELRLREIINDSKPALELYNSNLSDIDKLAINFNQIGVKFKVVSALDECGEEVYTYKDGNFNWDFCFEINEGKDYTGFFTRFYFLRGKFETHGCFE